jgi:hypothetical protein
MKIKIKIVAIFLAIALVLIEGYLIASSILDKANENNAVQTYCSVKCEYNPATFLWEFTGDNYTKGFTTRNECFKHCSDVKLGFTASLLNSVLKIVK